MYLFESSLLDLVCDRTSCNVATATIEGTSRSHDIAHYTVKVYLVIIYMGNQQAFQGLM